MSETFSKSVKPIVVEEIVDYYVFRRMAAWLVPVFAKLGFSPNGVSWFGLLLGLISAFLFFKGYFFIGSLMLWLTVVIDCVDGGLARYTGKTSPVGRILDGLFDAIWTSSIWWSIYFSELLWPFGGRDFVLVFMLTSGAFMCLHCWTFDAVKNRYLSLLIPEHNESSISSDQARIFMRESFKAGHYFEGFLYGVMSIFQKYFGAKQEGKPLIQLTDEQKEQARKLLDRPMRLWTFCGEGTHHAVMIFFGLLTFFNLKFMMVTFFIVVFVINFIWIVAFFSWSKNTKILLAQ